MARVKERRPPCPTRQKLDRTGNSAVRSEPRFRSTEMKTPSFTHLFGTVFEQRKGWHLFAAGRCFAAATTTMKAQRAALRFMRDYLRQNRWLHHNCICRACIKLAPRVCLGLVTRGRAGASHQDSL